MRTVWKFEIPMGPDDFTILYAEFGKIIHVGLDSEEKPHLWVELEKADPAVHHRFGIRGTGWEFKGNEREHIATWRSGALVWHLYWISWMEEEVPRDVERQRLVGATTGRMHMDAGL